STLSIPLLAGRDLNAADRKGTRRVAVVNGAFARELVSGGNPIGRAFTLYPGTVRALGPIEIVGVAADAINTSLRNPMPQTFYVPLEQFDYLGDLGIRTINLSIRTRNGSPMTLTRSVATAAATVNTQLALTFRPLANQIDASLTQERVVAMLAGFFGAL